MNRLLRTNRFSSRRIIFSLFLPLMLTLLVSACGGGGSDDGSIPLTPIQPVAQNVVPVSVDGLVFGSTNAPFVSVTLCSPTNAANCVTIDHILVDTGSVGLRVYAQPTINNVAVDLLSQLTLSQQTVAGNPLGECLPFALGVTWGPVKLANLQIGGESANNVAIQVIADPRFNSIPTACSSQGQVMSTTSSFGANGVLGIGTEQQDCGDACTAAFPAVNVYYSCTTNCVNVAMPLTNQVQNPVTLFSADNNGVILSLSAIPPSGSTAAAGTLTFGVDTQTNNASTNQNTIKIDINGFISSSFGGQNYPASFIDSGSNGYFFNTSDPAYLHCTGGANVFYCPTNTIVSNAIISGSAGSTSPASVTINVADANSLFSTQNYAFNNLGGTAVSLPGVGATFDFGLPFFFGKDVYVVVAGKSTAKGPGPYVGW